MRMQAVSREGAHATIGPHPAPSTPSDARADRPIVSATGARSESEAQAMNPWRPPTLDPELTLLALRARQHPEGHWVKFQAEQQAAARRRVALEAIGWALVSGTLLALVYAVGL
jgi:hypothetical protein